MKEDGLPESRPRQNMDIISTKNSQPTGPNLTEGAMVLIEGVVEKTRLTDPQELLPYVCDELMNRFPDDTLEYHCSQMHLQTTQDIVRSITCFFISKKLFPTKSYLPVNA